MNSKIVLWLGILVSLLFIIFCISSKLDQINPTEAKPQFIEEPIQVINTKEEEENETVPVVIIEPKEQNLSSNLQTLLESKKISFTRASSKLTTEGKIALDEVIQLIKNPNDIIVHISGHTDAKGNKELNQQLSQQRADSVKEYMISHGIITKIISKGYGSTIPLTKNKYDIKNRRVEITVQKDTK